MKTLSFILIPFFFASCSLPGDSTDTKVSGDSIKDTVSEIHKSITVFPEVTNPNKPLIKELDEIYNSDQGIRIKYMDLEKKYGHDSKEVKALTNEWRTIDSVNTLKVIAILDKYGWLGPDEIGNKGSTTLFLVIQHSEIEIQEKYLPMMREAVSQDKAAPGNLALLEDRVLISHEKKQIYGSQIEYDSLTKKYKLSPIEDEPNVNKRRATVGLEPLEEYVKYWDIKYVLPKK